MFNDWYETLLYDNVIKMSDQYTDPDLLGKLECDYCEFIDFIRFFPKFEDLNCEPILADGSQYLFTQYEMYCPICCLQTDKFIFYHPSQYNGIYLFDAKQRIRIAFKNFSSDWQLIRGLIGDS